MLPEYKETGNRRHIINFTTDEFCKRILEYGNLFRKPIDEVVSEMNQNIDGHAVRENAEEQRRKTEKMFCGNSTLADYWNKK